MLFFYSHQSNIYFGQTSLPSCTARESPFFAACLGWCLAFFAWGKGKLKSKHEILPLSFRGKKVILHYVEKMCLHEYSWNKVILTHCCCEVTLNVCFISTEQFLQQMKKTCTAIPENTVALGLRFCNCGSINLLQKHSRWSRNNCKS